VSSVLKALKKLEKEKHASTVKRLHGKRFDREFSGKSKQILYGIVCFVCIILFSLLFLILKPDQPVKDSKQQGLISSQVAVDMPETIKKPEKKDVNKVSFPEKKNQLPKTKFPRKKDWEKKRELSQADQVSQKKTPPKKAAGSQEDKNPVQTPASIVSESKSESPDPDSNRDDKFYQTYPGEDLQLQAIAWDSDPDRRFVMLNGSILHEDDQLDSVIIERINSEYVIIKVDDLSYLLNIKD